jgi:hypothetical protein
MRRPLRLLLGTATWLGLAAAAWLASRRLLEAPSEPESRSAGGEQPVTKKRPKTASARRAAAPRGSSKSAAARKAPAPKRSRARA